MGVDNQKAMIGTEREGCRTDMYGDYLVDIHHLLLLDPNDRLARAAIPNL